MITKEAWDNVYFSTMALASVGVSVLGVTIGLLSLSRSQAQAAGVGGLEPPTGYTPLSVKVPKVHYEDGQYLVSVRSPNEWHELREFVQPDGPYLGHAINEALYG